MRITYDPAKRALTRLERIVDFDSVVEIFAGPVFEIPDKRFDYGEERVITIGHFRGRMMVVVWTQRGDARHIISMRKANERERTRYGGLFSPN